MRERFDFFDESFGSIQETQELLARRGYIFCSVPLEHTEGLVTQPLLHRIRTQIKKRGFANVAGRLVLTFSGFAHDRREVFQIPEIRAYYRKLDQELPELPALVAVVDELSYNGPGLYLSSLGIPDERMIPSDPDYFQRYDLFVEGVDLVSQSLARIRQAGRKHHLSAQATERIVANFRRGLREGK
ncbi:MAG: hypothetical protein EPO21_21980 [Chloroflexota bacterium]|nr:MAG: hypothetical protein EPO21_21980 [Chloroflexota bacterium]